MTAPPEQELLEGTRLLDRYVIIDRVASGGMASIYRATDERLDRIVCVKLLRLELEETGSTSGGAVYQATYSHFLREALALSKLQHPNTLRIYDFGYLEEGGRPFQISEFLDGGNLEQHLRTRGAFGADEALGILERMTGAVAEAHEQKIIHRDIKPSNILFSRIGEQLMPKLADFGIAQVNVLRKPPREQHLDPDNWDSVSSIALFSPRWAAPEQLAGTPEGPATDVYALALVTAYTLSGRQPFDGPEVRNTFQDRVRGDELLSTRLTQMGISGELKRALLRSLAADPSRRVQSPLTFFEDLRSVLGGPRTSLPPMIPRRPVDSVTLSVEYVTPEHEPQLVQPPERSQTVGNRTVRVVQVHERLELTLAGPKGGEVRFRVSIVPVREAEFRINIKGLNCFVARADGPGARPTPAINASADGAVDFVSMSREWLGRISWSFGKVGPGGARAFRVSNGEIVVPSTEATYAVALDLGQDREVIVMCKRT